MRAILAILPLLLIAGCGDDEVTVVERHLLQPLSCTPGAQAACACPGGAPDGVQVCSSDGTSYGACACDEPSSSGTSSPTTTSSTTGSGGAGGSGGDGGAGHGGDGGEIACVWDAECRVLDPPCDGPACSSCTYRRCLNGRCATVSHGDGSWCLLTGVCEPGNCSPGVCVSDQCTAPMPVRCQVADTVYVGCDGLTHTEYRSIEAFNPGDNSRCTGQPWDFGYCTPGETCLVSTAETAPGYPLMGTCL